MSDTAMQALDGDVAVITARLGLQAHPEGGYFRETFREASPEGGRDRATAIYFLLPAGEVSHWHRIDATEIWHWYAGAALSLSIAPAGQTVRTVRLGPDIFAGEQPQAIVPPHAWQSAVSLGAWSLVGCTVAPAFIFDAFELAPPGWHPGT